MRPTNSRQFRLTNKKRRLPKWLRPALICVAAVVGVFVLANAVVALLYRGKVLPNYSVAAVPIGGTNFDQLDKKVSVEKLLPAKVKFVKDDKTQEVAPKDLGVTVDWDATREHIESSRNWLPVTSFLFKHSVPAELTLDNSKFAIAVQDLEKSFTKEALPERIAFRDNDFAIVAPEAGYQVSVVELRLEVVKVLEKGKTDLVVPTVATNSTDPTGKLQDELSKLQKQLDANITLMGGSQKRQLTRADLAGFFENSGQTLKLSEAKMAQVVAGAAQGLGVTPVNQGEAVQASLYAISKQQPVTFVLASQGARVYHYCVSARGVDASTLPEYRQKLAAVYGDPRGWNKGGSVTLVYAESGCDYTAWLSAPSSMTSFGGVCDNYYSCRSGVNVVVNYDRWMGATDPWNAAGGSLEDYRVMVINHETGHWFNFGHRNCPGAGQPAPVMQQQSISLAGCTFNPWPTAAELAAL